MTYRPKPIDTSKVTLSRDLARLTEKLAENVHELWATERIAEGWSYGRQRDEQRRTRPDLVPYGELPESEKGYDRRSAMETLRAIIALGYEITGPSPRGPSSSGTRGTRGRSANKSRKTT